MPRETNTFEIESLAWEKQSGLLPAIVQDSEDGRVLMLGYMDRAALANTLEQRRVTFYSRSKGRLWTKGEGSGHVLELIEIEADCDGDTLLVQARPRGPTCHLQRASCFADTAAREPAAGFLGSLDALVARRAQERPAGSYTTQLLESGLRRIAQKVGEEGVETCLAAVAQDDEALLGEAADLAFHLLVLLHARGLALPDLLRTLRARHKGAAPDA